MFRVFAAVKTAAVGFEKSKNHVEVNGIALPFSIEQIQVETRRMHVVYRAKLEMDFMPVGFVQPSPKFAGVAAAIGFEDGYAVEKGSVGSVAHCVTAVDPFPSFVVGGWQENFQVDLMGHAVGVGAAALPFSDEQRFGRIVCPGSSSGVEFFVEIKTASFADYHSRNQSDNQPFNFIGRIHY